jgi:pimeloyl-ACP methyl ester carboxylesterase
MRREQATIGRKQISYLISEPSAPAPRQHPTRHVLFLHAFPLQAAMWTQTLGAIPDGWRAIAPDLRGFGESPLPDSGPHRMSEFAGDAVDLLDHLHVTNAAVVGCSMGGYVLFEMLKSAPGYISAVALISTRPGPDSEEGKKNRDKMIEQVDREGVDPIATQMVPKLLGATAQAERPDLVKQVRNLIVANKRDGVKTAVTAMRDRADSTPLLAGIKVPALVVSGAEDTLIPPAEGDAMHRAIPEAQYERMPFAGHLPNLEQSASFDTLLWQFLQKL